MITETCCDYDLTAVLKSRQKSAELLQRNGFSNFPFLAKICTESLKVLQLQGFLPVCQKTPALKAAGSNPVGRADERSLFFD